MILDIVQESIRLSSPRQEAWGISASFSETIRSVFIACRASREVVAIAEGLIIAFDDLVKYR